MEAQLQEAEGVREGLEEKVNTLEELLTLKKTVGKVIRNMWWHRWKLLASWKLLFNDV